MWVEGGSRELKSVEFLGCLSLDNAGFCPVGEENGGTAGLVGPAVTSGLHAWTVEPLGQRQGSQLRGSWLKRNVQWAASAQEGLKKASASPGLRVRVIKGSSQLISLWLLWHLGEGLFPCPSLGFHQLAGTISLLQRCKL